MQRLRSKYRVVCRFQMLLDHATLRAIGVATRTDRTSLIVERVAWHTVIRITLLIGTQVPILICIRLSVFYLARMSANFGTLRSIEDRDVARLVVSTVEHIVIQNVAVEKFSWRVEDISFPWSSIRRKITRT